MHRYELPAANEPISYCHSGGLGVSPLLVPVAALISVGVLSISYAYLNVYCPVAGWISIIFAMAYAFGLTWTVAKVGYWSNCRNARFLQLMGLCIGLFGFYASWLAFEFVLIGRTDEHFKPTLVELFISPAAVWGIAAAVNESGWYSIHDFTPSGNVLWALWAAEGLLIVGMPTMYATMYIADQVFCDSCNRWCASHEHPIRLAVDRCRDFVNAVENKQLEYLERLPPIEQNQYPHLLLDIKQCDCETTAAAQLRMVKYRQDHDGNPAIDTENLTDYILLSGELRLRLEALRERVCGISGNEA